MSAHGSLVFSICVANALRRFYTMSNWFSPLPMSCAMPPQALCGRYRLVAMSFPSASRYANLCACSSLYCAAS